MQLLRLMFTGKWHLKKRYFIYRIRP